jgi:hypothetical protein
MPSASLKKKAPTAKREIRRNTPDPHKGFVKWPFEYEYLITGQKLSGLLQSHLLFLIARRTWGEEDRPEWCELSLSELAKLCGGFERKSVAVALADLISRRLIAVREKRGGCGEKGMYRLTPENWRRAKPYVAAKPAAEEEAEAADDETEESADADAQSPPSATVSPGRVSRPQAVRIAIKGTADPVELHMVYHCQFTEPLAFRTRPGSNGRLQVTVSKPTATPTERIGGCSRAQLHPPHPAIDTKELNDYQIVTNRLCQEFWGTVPDPELVRLVMKSAGGAPPELFERIARERLKVNRRQNRPGLLPFIAADAERTHLMAEATKPGPAPDLSFESFKGPLDKTLRWDRIRAVLKTRLAPHVYDNWFLLTKQLEETATNTTVLDFAGDKHSGFLTVEFSELIASICAELHEPATILWRVDR